MLTVEVFADVTSPWCFIGKRRLEAALSSLSGRVRASVLWLPFETDPARPPVGVDRRSYRTARLGSWERSLALDAETNAAGRREGIAFAFDRIARVPNARDPHRLLALAGREAAQDALLERLLRAHFVEGRDLSSRETLLDLAAEAGLDRALAAAWLEGDDGTAELRAAAGRARLIGVRKVPFFVLAGLYTLDRPWDAGTIAEAIGRVALPAPLAPSPSGAEAGRFGFTRTRCGCDFCRAYCRYTPGRLDVDDLARMCPPGEDVFAWAERHLRAVTDVPQPKLVPVRGEDGACHWYGDAGCAVHANAPYGCAYFDAHMSPEEVNRRSRAATQASLQDAARDGLYHRVWRHLRDKGLTSPSGDRAGLDEAFRRLGDAMDAN